MGHDGCVRRLLLIEGIPGSGKTTTAGTAARWLERRGVHVSLFREGDPHPVDLAWQWWLAPAQFADLCREHPGAAAELRRCAWIGTAGVSIAYTRVDPGRCGGQWPGVAAAMTGREPYGGVVPASTFVDILAARWAEFGATAADSEGREVAIFDGTLLQNTLVELVLFGECDAATITADLRRLVAAVSPWRPVLLRLVPAEPGAAVAAVSRQRVDADGRPRWRDAVEDYTADTPWARAQGLTAPGALMAYLGHRQQVEAEILPNLPLRWADLPSPAGSTESWGPFEGSLTDVLAGLVRQQVG